MSRAVLLLPLTLALALACTQDRPPATIPYAASTTAAAAPIPHLAAPPTRTGTTARPLILVPEPPRADRIDLARRYRGVVAAPSPLTGTTERPGETREFWVIQSEPPRAFLVSATLRRLTPHAALYVQDGARVTDEEIAAAAAEFESRVYPGVVALTGPPAPPPAGADPRITILHLNLPAVGGYFTGIDRLPRSVARTSNERRMIYIDLRAGRPGTPAYAGLVAHELQHLIHYDRNPVADAWLNEGLSELVNEIVGDAREPLRAYQNAPGTPLVEWPVSGNTAAHYDAARSFVRYLLRHYGGFERAGALAAAGGTGINAVQRYLHDGRFGAGFEDVFADWLVAGYLNLPGEGRFSNPGADATVRQRTRLSRAESGRGELAQFGAAFFEVDPQGRPGIFRLQASTSVKQVPNEPVSGSGQYWSGRGDSINTTLTRELDLRGVRSAVLRFKLWHDIEWGYDYAYVAISTDGGTRWTALRGRQATEADPLGYAYGPGYTGVSGGRTPTWVDEEIDLTPFAGHLVLLRFEHITDESASGAGMAIDDITVPEIGLFDDAEQDSGWQAVGFRRLSGPLPQRYLVQLVVNEPEGWSAHRIELAPDGSAEIPIPGGRGTVGLIIAPVTYGTHLPARFEWSYTPAGR